MKLLVKSKRGWRAGVKTRPPEGNRTVKGSGEEHGEVRENLTESRKWSGDH